MSIAATIPSPHKNSPAFLSRGRAVDKLISGEPDPDLAWKMRRSPSTPAAVGGGGGGGGGSSSQGSRLARPLTQSGSSGRLAPDRGISPASFAAEIEGSLDHRIARVVIVPATLRALRQMRASNPQRFWNCIYFTDTFKVPIK